MDNPIRREDPEGQAPIPVTNLPDSEPISIQDRPPPRTERGERTDITRTPHSVGGSPRTSRTELIEATNALGANQREHSLRLTSVETGLTEVMTDLADFRVEMADFRQETQARFRSVDEHLAEIKDLIIGGRNTQ